MKTLIKILVENEDQLDQLIEVLEEAEENGELDFGFAVRSCSPMKDQLARENFFKEFKS